MIIEKWNKINNVPNLPVDPKYQIGTDKIYQIMYPTTSIPTGQLYPSLRNASAGESGSFTYTNSNSYFVHGILGNDFTGNGNYLTPYKTIAKALTNYNPSRNNIVILDSSVYDEDIYVLSTIAYRINIVAVQGETPIIKNSSLAFQNVNSDFEADLTTYSRFLPDIDKFIQFYDSGVTPNFPGVKFYNYGNPTAFYTYSPGSPSFVLDGGYYDFTNNYYFTEFNQSTFKNYEKNMNFTTSTLSSIDMTALTNYSTFCTSQSRIKIANNINDINSARWRGITWNNSNDNVYYCLTDATNFYGFVVANIPASTLSLSNNFIFLKDDMVYMLFTVFGATDPNDDGVYLYNIDTNKTTHCFVGTWRERAVNCFEYDGEIYLAHKVLNKTYKLNTITETFDEVADFYVHDLISFLTFDKDQYVCFLSAYFYETYLAYTSTLGRLVTDSKYLNLHIAKVSDPFTIVETILINNSSLFQNRNNTPYLPYGNGCFYKKDNKVFFNQNNFVAQPDDKIRFKDAYMWEADNSIPYFEGIELQSSFEFQCPVKNDLSSDSFQIYYEYCELKDFYSATERYPTHFINTIINSCNYWIYKFYEASVYDMFRVFRNCIMVNCPEVSVVYDAGGQRIYLDKCHFINSGALLLGENLFDDPSQTVDYSGLLNGVFYNCLNEYCLYAYNQIEKLIVNQILQLIGSLYYLYSGTENYVNENVYYLMHMLDDPNFGTYTAADYGIYSHRVSINLGSLSPSTSIKKFWDASLYFNGGNLYTVAMEKLIGSADFSLDFWMYCPTDPSYDFIVFGYDSKASGFRVDFSPDNGRVIFWIKNTLVYADIPSFSLNQWNHVVVGRDNGNFYISANGTRLIYTGLTKDLNTISNDFWFGSAPGISTNRFIGYLDEIRFCIDEAKFSGTTYAVPTNPYLNYKQNQLISAKPYFNVFDYNLNKLEPNYDINIPCLDLFNEDYRPVGHYANSNLYNKDIEAEYPNYFPYSFDSSEQIKNQGAILKIDSDSQPKAVFEDTATNQKFDLTLDGYPFSINKSTNLKLNLSINNLNSDEFLRLRDLLINEDNLFEIRFKDLAQSLGYPYTSYLTDIYNSIYFYHQNRVQITLPIKGSNNSLYTEGYSYFDRPHSIHKLSNPVERGYLCKYIPNTLRSDISNSKDKYIDTEDKVYYKNIFLQFSLITNLDGLV